MSNFNLILAALDHFPSLRQINEASMYAEKIMIGYVKKIDPYALITVDDGDVNIYSDCFFKDLTPNAQDIFDTAFAEKIAMIQGSYGLQHYTQPVSFLRIVAE